MINEANEQLANDTDNQWAQLPMWNVNVVKPIQCTPIRYALSGVYIHCNTNAKDTSGSNPAWFRNNFGVNVDTEFNAFFVEWIGDSNGEADGIPGRAFTAETFAKGVFNHEMGHVLSLDHTHRPDNLDDTPYIRYKIDYNCDGDNDDSWGSGTSFLSEATVHKGVHCKLADCPPAQMVVTPYDPLDYDRDGVINYQDPCNPLASELEAGASLEGCMPQPACDDDYHSNNMMGYHHSVNGHGVFTEDQITVMLDYLSSDVGCDYIEEITDDICNPPMSNIHVFPNESSDDCAYCFQLEASMHDEYYKVDFYNSSGSLLHTTDWREGPAKEYCISQSAKYLGQYRYGFQPNVEYKAVLTTENYCGDEAEETFSFTLPPLPPGGCLAVSADIEFVSLFPNPFINTVNYVFKTTREGYLKVWLMPVTPGLSDILLRTELLNSDGNFSRTAHPGNVPSGLYYMVLDLDGQISHSSLLKL